MEDDLKILKEEYLSNHWLVLSQILNLNWGDQTETKYWLKWKYYPIKEFSNPIPAQLSLFKNSRYFEERSTNQPTDRPTWVGILLVNPRGREQIFFVSFAQIQQSETLGSHTPARYLTNSILFQMKDDLNFFL